MLRNPFDFLLNLNGRSAKLIRAGIEYEIKVSYSNYHRNASVTSNITSKGREFVISQTNIDKAGLTTVKIKDIIQVNGDHLSIIEVNEMTDVGGAIIGYRVRTN